MGRDIWSMTDDEMERFASAHCSYIFQGYPTSSRGLPR